LDTLRRCLSLAKALNRVGVECRFLVDGDAAAVESISRGGYIARLVTLADAPERSLQFLTDLGHAAIGRRFI